MSTYTCACQTKNKSDSLTGEREAESVCGCKTGEKKLTAGQNFKVLNNSVLIENSFADTECCGGNCACSN